MKRNRKQSFRSSLGRGARGPRPVRAEVQGPEEIAAMRAAGHLAGLILDEVAAFVRPGVSTGAIDRLVDEITRDHGAVSAPLGYGRPPFPGHCCTSINDVVCHGIPDEERVLEEGDILNVDVTPIVAGFHGDSSRTFLVGDVSPKARQLVADTYRAMWLGIRAVKPGGRIGDIGHAIQTFAEFQGYSVVREFTGHGIGRAFHGPPAVLHYGTPGTGDVLLPGMTFTIEPMINLGHWKTEILGDGWTAVTVDGSLSAQWEHTCLVTEDGAQVLTLGGREAPPL
jgi:methionyl aminopeptidase